MDKTKKDKKPKKEPVSMLGFSDDEYCVRSKIANSRGMPFQEGYPVILRPAYSVSHEDPDDMEYCASPDARDDCYDIPVVDFDGYEDDYDGWPRQIGHILNNDSYHYEQDYGVRRRTKYPDGYDG